MYIEYLSVSVKMNHWPLSGMEEVLCSLFVPSCQLVSFQEFCPIGGSALASVNNR